MSFILTLFMCFGVSAQTNTAPTTLADVKTGVIANLQKDGFLSEKMAREAAQKYVTQSDQQTGITFNMKSNEKSDGPTSPTSNAAGSASSMASTSTINWAQYLSLQNFLAVAGVILLFVAFSGAIKKLIRSFWHVIVLVPAFVYQSAFLAATVFGTIFPEKIWASQAFYIALFCSFANLVVLGWIVASYKWVQVFLEKLFNFGIPPAIVASFWSMVYFGALAIAYESSIFGFFAAVGLSGMFSFCIMYMPGVMVLNFKENALVPLVFGHILILVVYAFAYNQGWGMPYMTYFNAGIQYYCTIALGVGLLVGASPWWKTSQALAYAVLFCMVAVAGAFAYFFLGLPTIGSIILVFFALMFLEWVGYMSFKTGWLVGCAVMGAILFGASLVMQNYGPMIMTALKAGIN